MVLDKKIFKKAYSPYFKEARYCFIIYLCVSVSVVLFFVCFAAIKQIEVFLFLVPVLIVYALCEFATNYRLIFMIILENARCKKQTVIINRIVTEHSWSGHLWNSVLPKLYEKKQLVNRYKLICHDPNGKKVILRCVMSAKKCKFLQNRIFESLSTQCVIVYGKYSKIVICYESNQSWTDQLNHMF